MKARKSRKSAETAKTDSKEPVWQKTKYANLVRYVPSGTLFARFKVRGKLIRRSLDTTDLAVAKRGLNDLIAKESAAVDGPRDGNLTFGDALKEYRERGYRVGIRGRTVRKKKPLKPRTRAYYEERIKALLKSWSQLEGTLVRKITAKDCEQWADKFSQKTSPSVYNHTIAILQHVLEIGVQNGARYDNPALSMGRMPDRPKKLQLPEPAQFEQFLKELETAGGRFSKHCADLVRFLAFGGFRKGEAANVLWKDCDFKKGIIYIWGDPETRTKNGEFRTVPMIKPMRTLLQQLRAERPDEPGEYQVMQIRECQMAMDRAADKVSMPRLTHHDLRHLFITRCIESGVDIPTISRWVGHKDGGMLLMRVYGHLCDHHSVKMAEQVTFSDTPNADRNAA